MTDTTLEEARRCPFTCKEPGKFVRQLPAPGAPRGTKVELYECTNERCDYSGERWSIQINPDGTVPPKGEGLRGPKQFDIMRNTTESQRQRARDSLRQMEERQRSAGGEWVR